MPFPEFSIITREELDDFIASEELRIQPILDRLQAELNANLAQWEASTRDITNLRFVYDRLSERLHNPRIRHTALAQQAQLRRDLPVLLHIRKLLEMIRLTTQECLDNEQFPLKEAKRERNKRIQLGTD